MALCWRLLLGLCGVSGLLVWGAARADGIAAPERALELASARPGAPMVGTDRQRDESRLAGPDRSSAVAASAPANERAGAAPVTSKLTFKKVNSVQEVMTAVAQAGRPVMLNFHADWCLSCQQMERFTFSDAAVQAALRGAVLLKADVTANTPAHRALLKHFRLFGPPGIVFFDAQGHELPGLRVLGYQPAPVFLEVMKAAGLVPT